MAATLTGRCFCGAIRFRIDAEVRDLCYCHCQSCRRAAGAPSVAWGTVDESAFVLMHGQLTKFRSSPPVERGFCNQCGSTLTYQRDDRRGELDFTLVSLDDPSAVAPRLHIWVRDKVPWESFNDGLPQYEGVADD